ncbi:MAG: phosphotransferase [Marinobacter sp.]|uniref:phosphotransferase n=1 Tax=Marinobacter sp. TaxID=50741 RepID=UPI003F9D145E
MLSRSDQAIVADDPALPGLDLALDPSALSATLGLPPMRSVYLRYKPGVSCVAALVPVSGDALQAVAVMAYPPDRFAEVRSRREWQRGPTPARFHDSACIAVVPLGRDRALKGARRIANPEHGRDFLRALTGQEPTGDPQLLRYKAGRRLVISIGDWPHRALVKAYTKQDFAAALEGAQIAEVLGGAPVLGVSHRRRCIAWRWLEATPLAIETGTRSQWLAAGRALARVHQAQPRPEAILSRNEEVTELASSAADLEPLAPQLSQLAATLAKTLAERLARAAFAPTLIHGDFSADQILIQNTRAVVIDWDRAATGDPARDAGTFLAQLDARHIDGAAGVSDAADGFLEGYSAANGPAQAATITLQHARALLALVTEGFRQRRSDWPQRAFRLLARASVVLGEQPAPHSYPPLDAGMPALDDALAPDVIAPRLAMCLSREVPSVDSELLRHKPGRRALIRYRIERRDPEAPWVLLGKLRAKGPDTRTPALHTALRAQGLDGQAPWRVGVPAAHGGITAPPVWLQEEVPGYSLETRLQPGAGSRVAALTGAALARLHTAAVPADRQWSMVDELNVLVRALNAARSRLPARAVQLDAIADAAGRIMRSLEPTTNTSIHRDFYPEQVRVDGDTIWLLDFDLYAHSDPAIDLANFLAHLDELGLRRHGRLDALRPQGEAFRAAYNTVRPGISQRRVQRLRLVALARHIHLSQIIPGRSHTTSALIDHCTSAFFSMERHDQTNPA